MSTPSASDLYARGNLSAALDALTSAVKSNPRDMEARGFLAELLCVRGELDRADAQLDAMAKLDAGASPGIALFRQLIRAERWRHEVHRQGRAPEVLAAPSPAVRAALQALAELRAGDGAAATKTVQAAEEQRTRPQGKCDGAPFDDLRDLDDVCSGVLELLTSTGKCIWAPFETIVSIQFDKPLRPRDLLWRPADVSIRGGPDGKVFVPLTYAPTRGEPDDAARLGRSTDWLGAEGEIMTGVGLRTFLVGDKALTALEFDSLEFSG